jgi:hypothetical protein
MTHLPKYLLDADTFIRDKSGRAIVPNTACRASSARQTQL